MSGPGGDGGESRQERRQRLSRLATDYPALAARLRALGVDGVIAELTEPEPLEYWYSDIPPVRRALVRGRDILAADPAALPAVLVRFLWGEEEAIDRLRRDAAARVVEEERPPWEGETIAPIDEIPHPSSWIEALFPLPSGSRALVVGSDGAVAVVAPGTAEVLAERPSAPEADDVVAASFRAPWLYIADLGGRIVRWRVGDGPADPPLAAAPGVVVRGDPSADLSESPQGVPLAIAALPSPDGLLVGYADGAVSLLDLHTGDVAWSGRHGGPVNAIAVTPDGRVAVSGADDGAVLVWDVPTGRVVHTLRGHTRSVRAVAVSPDGKAVVSGSADRSARLWVDGRCTAVLAGAETGSDPVPELGPAPSGSTGHWRAVTAVLLTADDIVTASADHTIRVWDRATGTETAVLAGEPFGLVTRHEGAVQALALGDGRLVSGGHDGRVLVWDALSLALEPFPAPLPPQADARPAWERAASSLPHRLAREHDRALRWEDRDSTRRGETAAAGIAVHTQVDVTVADDEEAVAWVVAGPVDRVDVDLTRALARIARRHPPARVAVDDLRTGPAAGDVTQVVVASWRGGESGLADAVPHLAAAAREVRSLLGEGEPDPEPTTAPPPRSPHPVGAPPPNPRAEPAGTAPPDRAPSSTSPAPTRWAVPDRDLFVSYKSEDVMLVRPVVDALLAAGARVWFAEYEILLAGRERFAEAIAAGIRRSRRALLFTNDRYLASPYCRDELQQCLAVHGAADIIEVMLPEEQGSHAAYPALANADWTEGDDPDRIAAWVARRVGVTPVRRPSLAHHVYRDAAGRHSGADRSPGTHRGTLAGVPYSVDVTGWTVEKPPRARRNDPTWLPTYKYAVERPPLFVNIAAGLEVSPEAQRMPGVGDDRAVYDFLLGYAPRHLSAVGGDVRGVHLLLRDGVGQMGLTYTAHGVWTRKISMIIRSPVGGQTAEIVFTFAVPGTWEEYDLLTVLMDRLATSVKWG